MTACASVEVGVYGFTARSSRADGRGGGSVFRALLSWMRRCWGMKEDGRTVKRLVGDPRCYVPYVKVPIPHGTF